jgi:transcriptional regulator with PAS, ATPase and Fis domain
MNDYKTRFNLYCQKNHLPLPKYEFTQGDDLKFECMVDWKGAIVKSTQKYDTKKEASQAVALQILTCETSNVTVITETKESIPDDHNTTNICLQTTKRIYWNPFQFKDQIDLFRQKELIIVDLDNRNLTSQELQSYNDISFITFSNSVCEKVVYVDPTNIKRIVNFECKGIERDLADCAIIASIQSILESNVDLVIYLVTGDHFATSVVSCYGTNRVVHLCRLDQFREHNRVQV